MEVSWLVELTVEPDRVGEFWALTEEMVEASTQEPGTLIYERSMDDNGVIHLYERYVDAEAALAHMQAFAERFSPTFSALVERRRFTVYGEPTPELRAVLNTVGATYAAPVAGFSRSMTE
jgi:quinol monooxygenase YgiN